MKPSKDLEHLLKVFYRMYCKNEVVRQYGLFPWELTGASGIHFGDAGDALAAVERMRERGWIKVPSTRHRGRVGPSDRIKLTEKGIGHAEWLLGPRYRRYLKDIYVATVEGITRDLTRR